MNFLKGFLGGVVFFILIIVSVPLLSEGMPPTEVFERLTKHSEDIPGIAQMVFMCGIVFGLMNQLICWLKRRNTERTETDRLMREYLERKLMEDIEKDYER